MLSSFIFVHCHLEWLCKMTFMVTVGATLACGTGACAVVVAAVLEGRAERVCVSFLFFSLFSHIDSCSQYFGLYINRLSFNCKTEMRS